VTPAWCGGPDRPALRYALARLGIGVFHRGHATLGGAFRQKRPSARGLNNGPPATGIPGTPMDFQAPYALRGVRMSLRMSSYDTPLGRARAGLRFTIIAQHRRWACDRR